MTEHGIENAESTRGLELAFVQAYDTREAEAVAPRIRSDSILRAGLRYKRWLQKLAQIAERYMSRRKARDSRRAVGAELCDTVRSHVR